MRAAVCVTALIAALGAGIEASAQVLPPPPSTFFEPLPPADPNDAGPAVEFFDLDAWLVGGEMNPLAPRDDWRWQLLPDGIMYRAYLANPKESRLGTQIFNSTGNGALWDSTLGGRVGLLRFGTNDPAWPQGWQFDVEGSAQVRLDPDENVDLRSVDYRVGAPLTSGY